MSCLPGASRERTHQSSVCHLHLIVSTIVDFGHCTASRETTGAINRIFNVVPWGILGLPNFGLLSRSNTLVLSRSNTLPPHHRRYAWATPHGNLLVAWAVKITLMLGALRCSVETSSNQFTPLHARIFGNALHDAKPCIVGISGLFGRSSTAWNI